MFSLKILIFLFFIVVASTFFLEEDLNDFLNFQFEEIIPTILTNEDCFEKSKVVIIGAGPVGLFSAFNLLGKGFCVEMYEGRLDSNDQITGSSARNQIIYMDVDAKLMLPSTVKQYMVANGDFCLSSDGYLGCTGAGDYSSFRLAGLQNAFIRHLKTFTTFKITKKTIQAGDTFRDIRFILMADGGGASSYSKNFFLNKKCSGEIQRSVIWMGELTVSQENDDYLTSTTAINNHQVTHRALETGPVGGNKYKIYVSSVMKNPEDKIISTLKLIKIAHGDGCYDIQKAVTVPINLCTALTFAKNVDEVIMVLIGDAAFSTHYYTGTGFNYGMKALRELLKQIEVVKDHFEIKTGKYNTEMRKLQLEQSTGPINTYLTSAALNSEIITNKDLFDTYVSQCQRL